LTPAGDLLSVPALEAAARRLQGIVSSGRPALVGESAVASTCVHLTDPTRPGEVRVLASADAGVVFYGRKGAGEILHLDVFHEVGEVDHVRVANAVRAAVRGAASGPGAVLRGSADVERCLDYTDVQTGTGGGRVSGGLAFGRRASLRRAHMNHVHLTAAWYRRWCKLVLLLVDAVEEEVQRQGLEIRAVEDAVVETGGDREVDMRDYSAPSDSFMRGRSGTRGEGCEGAYGREFEQLVDMAQECPDVEELYSCLRSVARDAGRGAHGPELCPWPTERWAQALERRGYVERRCGSLFLTDEGGRMLEYLERHRSELRRLLRRMEGSGSRLSGLGRLGRRGRNERRGVRSREAVSPDRRSWIENLAVAETVASAARRAVAEGRASIRITRSDLRCYPRRKRNARDICLLIDASASMAGRRMAAAKQLARYLVAEGRDRVAVVSFQERGATIRVPFTRDHRSVEIGLERLKPYGLTPMASGLWECLSFVRGSRLRSPLVLLITDGVPTVPRWSMNALGDALEAARCVGRTKLPFACVGLEPNREFLEELSDAAGGALYVVRELDADTLVAIARREKRLRAEE